MPPHMRREGTSILRRPPLPALDPFFFLFGHVRYDGNDPWMVMAASCQLPRPAYRSLSAVGVNDANG